MKTTHHIMWDSPESHILLNPRCSDDLRVRFLKMFEYAPSFERHVWLATSGSSGKLKLVALSKEALLCSAEAVNRHLDASSNDRWGLALPKFHVGGIGVLARAYVSGASSVEMTPWDVNFFQKQLSDQHVTLVSLVPTQIHDLVHIGCEAPPLLRAVIVGGGPLSPKLYLQARKLGWNLLPSYGLTECCSQVATASLETLDGYENPSLKILDHMKVRVSSQGLLEFCGNSLFTGHLCEHEEGAIFSDLKRNGWFTSDDRGSLFGDHLLFHGRVDDMIKIGGESVDLTRLDHLLHDLAIEIGFSGDAVLIPVSNERLGSVIHLFVAQARADQVSELYVRFNATVLPFERIRVVNQMKELHRSSLGKILKNEMRAFKEPQSRT